MVRPPLPPPDSLKPNATLASGRYRLTRKLKAGGNGVVWLARHSAMDIDVIIKFPRRWAAGSSAADSQLEREVQSLVSFSSRHPHIVNILDVGEDGGRRFVVTQFMKNGSLQEFCAGLRRNELQNAAKELQSLSWLMQTANALDFIHHAGLIHRDVKPANVLLDESFSAYLADFGIAVDDDVPHRTTNSTAEQAGYVVGSLPYMAPELLTGGRATSTSDQFALGVTFYEFVLGVVPFPGSASTELFQSQKGTLRRWSTTNSVAGLNDLCGRTLRRALDANPAKRFPDCRTFAAELISAWHPSFTALGSAGSDKSSDTTQDLPSTVRTASMEGRAKPSKPKPPLPPAVKPIAKNRTLNIDRLLDEENSNRNSTI